MNRIRQHRYVSIASIAIGIALSVAFDGCSTTVESQPEAAKAITEGGPLPASVTGFLGSDASRLKQGANAALAWTDPAANWASYNKVLLEPVQFWSSADTKVSAQDQQVLTAYFYNALKDNISKQGFTLVDAPGPGVLRLQIALMDATASTPGLRTISVVVPQARVLNLAQSLATHSYAFVGSAEAEMKATDSMTGELLAEAVDQRAGGMGLKGATSFEWGDAQNVMDYWAQLIPHRLRELQGGASTAVQS